MGKPTTRVTAVSPYFSLKHLLSSAGGRTGRENGSHKNPHLSVTPIYDASK